jgi:hypothetical protein
LDGQHVVADVERQLPSSRLLLGDCPDQPLDAVVDGLVISTTRVSRWMDCSSRVCSTGFEV